MVLGIWRNQERLH